MQLLTNELPIVDPDPPINKTAPTLDDVKDMAKLRSRKVDCVCNISAEQLKAGGMDCMVLTVIW